MKPTALIQLAHDICICTDRGERRRLFLGCPKAFHGLLQSNISVIQANRRRLSAIDKAQQVLARKKALIAADKRQANSERYRKYKQRSNAAKSVKKLIPSVALNNCQKMRELLAGSA